MASNVHVKKTMCILVLCNTPRVMCLNGQLPNLISVVGSLIVLDFVVFMVG